MAARSLLDGCLVLMLLQLILLLNFSPVPVVQAIQTVSFSFEENTGADYSVGRLAANQQGSSSSSSSNDYEFTGGSSMVCKKYFNLVRETGEILTNINIDREAVIEEMESENITCQVSHDSNTLQVQFHILDENDVIPEISGLSQPIKVYENVPIGQIIAYLMPVDMDAGLNGTVNFTIMSGNEEGFFSLSVSSGQSDLSDRILVLRKSLNYETRQTFNLSLFVTDEGTPRLNTTQYLVIDIIDVNDEEPTFNIDFHFKVFENHTVGSLHPIGIINATDSDSAAHSQIFYQLDIENSRDPEAADFFAVNTTSGELYLIDRLDFDQTSKHLYEFRIEARNPGSPSGTKAEITVTILDANDELPELRPTSTTIQGVYENDPDSNFLFVFRDADIANGDNEIGTVEVKIEPQVEYTVQTTVIASTTLIAVTVSQPIDREWTDSLLLSVNVSDRGSPPLVSIINWTIPIFDVNDNSPQFSQSSYQACISSSSRPEMGVAHITAVDPDEGENGKVIYTISNVSPSIAKSWFKINNLTGLVTLVLPLNLQYTHDGINITITARDNGTNPLTNTTTLNITTITYVTFQPISFQQYSNVNLLSSALVYMEFKTLSTNALLLYQSSHSSFSSLEIINGSPVFEKRIFSNVYVSNNKWYCLLLNKTKGTLEVWKRNETSIGNKSLVDQLLQTASVRECSSQQQVSTNNPLYIGGVPNIFTIPAGHISPNDFTGIIATVVINEHHIDFSCPYSSRNTLHGSYFTNICEITPPCSGSHAYCDPYSPSNSRAPCHCTNGLPIQTCDQEQDYGPITINNGYIQFELDYDFFFSSLTRNNKISRQWQHQTITFSFVPKDSSLSGLLFYSRTSDTVYQRLEVSKTFRYTISVDNMPRISLVSGTVNFEAGKEYTLELNLTSKADNMTMTLKEGKSLKFLPLTATNFGENVFYPFASQPNTTVSLGGTTNTNAMSVTGQFNGCITGFTIDSVAIPLQGLMTQNFTFTPGRALPFCHPCNMAATCPGNSTCHTNGDSSNSLYRCTCNEGSTNISGVCLLTPRLSSTPTTLFSSISTPSTTGVPPITDGLNTHGSSFKLYYIVVIACTVIFITSLIIVLLAVMFRCAYTRGKKDTQRPQLVTQITYHQGNSECCHDDNKDLTDGGSIIPMSTKRSNDYVKTHLIKTGRASFDENDSVLGSINSPCSYRKSTSQETGFHTASEGPSTRSSPHRRSVSKDSERYDSDFTSFETDSEDLTTSGIEEVMSPNEVRLVSSGSMMGVPASFRIQNPLTPHEKNVMTPLKPNSSMLLSEDETDTEVSTTTNTNRRRYYDNDSLVSEQNAPDWYKTSSPSTVVESENETPYGSKAAALHKASSSTRHKHRPPSLPHINKPYKGSSPHGSPYSLGGYPHHSSSNGHLSSSPLIKSHRPFDYPTTGAPPSTMPHMIPSTAMYSGYLDHHIVDQNRLPVIAESSFQYHHPYPPNPTTATNPHHRNPYHSRQHDTSPRSPYSPAQPATHAPYDPTHAPYYPGYQGTSLTPGGGGPTPTTYCDLNSFSKVNPITYWEQQQRLRPIVDQDDPLRFLTEPCRKFEDVSTTPSVAESSVIDSIADKESAVSVPTRRPITSRGVYSDNIVLPRTLPPHPLAPPLENELEDEEEEEEREGGEEDEEITHFPSADCTPTLLSPNSDTNNIHLQHSVSTLHDDTQNSYHFPDYA